MNKKKKVRMIKDEYGFEYEDVFDPNYQPPNLAKIAEEITKEDEQKWLKRFEKNLGRFLK